MILHLLALASASHIAIAADRIPNFNVEPSPSRVK
jgi:hypothetical protein